MGIREDLHPEERGNKSVYIPSTCYMLSKQEKRQFYTTLSDMKVTSGYFSNVQSLVQMKDLQIIKLKSHDFHTLMQYLLPIAFWGVLPILLGMQ